MRFFFNFNNFNFISTNTIYIYILSFITGCLNNTRENSEFSEFYKRTYLNYKSINMPNNIEKSIFLLAIYFNKKKRKQKKTKI